MENFTCFTQEEDDFIRTHFSLKISRLAIRLNRQYFMVEQRCINLGLCKKQTNGRYYTEDEEDYNLLKDGCTEDEIKVLRGKKNVFPTKETRSVGFRLE